MRSEFKICIIVLASIAIGAVGSWFLFGRPAGAVESQSEVHGQRLAKASRSGSVKKVTEISVDRKTGKKSVRIVESEETRPNVIEDADIDDLDQLSDTQRSVLNEIQSALDADDVKALRKALSRFTASVKAGGLGGYANVPRVIRSAAVQALGWFGKDAVVDMIDFMADADEEISDDAFNQFEQALQDCEMGDRERSSLIKTVSKALTDSDRIDTMVSCLIDMRNSVKADTAIAILTDGSDQSKAALLDQMEFYFDEGVQTVDDIKKWMAENPDDPEDEEFYGGEK
jgi:hypothetical protein